MFAQGRELALVTSNEEHESFRGGSDEAPVERPQLVEEDVCEYRGNLASIIQVHLQRVNRVVVVQLEPKRQKDDVRLGR